MAAVKLDGLVDALCAHYAEEYLARELVTHIRTVKRWRARITKPTNANMRRIVALARRVGIEVEA